MRALIADLIAVALLTTYGTEVCPYVQSLGWAGCALHVGIAFLIAHALGRWVERRFIDRAPEVERAGRTYWTTLGRYVAAGLGVGAVHVLVLAFPIVSPMRLMIGVLALGHFAGVDSALAKERAVMDALARSGSSLSRIERPRSFIRRLLLFALGAVAATTTVVTLLLARDLELLEQAGMSGMREMQRAMVIELFSIGGVLLALSFSLLASFASNLRRFLENETRVLEEVSRGELDRSVPVLSNDEFGVIASHTNRMIEGLRERRRVREVLGKIVSPDVARVLLDARGLSLGGERRVLTLLFSDVRDFTRWSEQTEPEVLVRDLNRYFTEMVSIVHAEGGVVDKFIGDGMMAVFGLDESEGATEAAARAGRRMLEALAGLQHELSHPMAIGIGIHRGDVVAGNIGSPDRLEFTFIGDAVNTAARIEALTRKVEAPLLVSGAVYAALGEAERVRWHTRGSHELKGKSEGLEVFAPSS